MVPLLLRHLGVNDYLLWSIFVAFGGLSLQLESSIQMVSVRDIARPYHGGLVDVMRAAVVNARRMYHGLAVLVGTLFAVVGFAYLMYVVGDKAGEHWRLEWALFVLSYTINYWFGVNSAVLLATDRVAVFSLISGSTRLLNLALSWVMLTNGLSVLGICISFAASVFVNVILIWLARRRLFCPGPVEERLVPEASSSNLGKNDRASQEMPRNLLKYTLYVFATYMLYRGSVLMATTFFPAKQVASYALALQAFGMVATLSMVPVHAWLAICGVVRVVCESWQISLQSHIDVISK